MRVRFVRNPLPREGGAGFAAGEVYDLPARSADRWKRRGAVVDVPAEPEAPALALVVANPPAPEPAVLEEQPAETTGDAPADDSNGGPRRRK